MPAWKAIIVILIGGAVLASALFAFVPSTRPAIVKKWIMQSRGFTPATSPDDALDKFKRAIELRDYEAAALYTTGDYLDPLIRCGPDAAQVAYAVDELKDVMKSTGTKSDKVDVVLFRFDPFPTFKYTTTKTSSGATATISWVEELARFKGVQTQFDNFKPEVLTMYHTLLPTIAPTTMTVNLEEKDGAWKIAWPAKWAGLGARQLSESRENLRKNATNLRNTLRDIKASIKNNPAVKEDFEREFKSNVEKAF